MLSTQLAPTVSQIIRQQIKFGRWAKSYENKKSLVGEPNHTKTKKKIGMSAKSYENKKKFGRWAKWYENNKSLVIFYYFH